jgi:16S rRNA (cytidine1402-2'-O)-methyltransferase
MAKKASGKPGTLYLVATPIGNLGDISARALATLQNVDLIACEDTRHTKKLLNHFGISARLVSYHEHNEKEKGGELIAKLREGLSIALVSDAGTPGINDPGGLLVRLAHDADVRVVPVPGPAAFVSAVAASGLPTDSIFFGGFLPSTRGERQRRLIELRSVPATMVFYESPRRIGRALADISQVLGNRRAAIARELTKLHEEIVTGTIDELITVFSSANLRGEFVLIIDRERGPREASAVTGSIENRLQEFAESGIVGKAAIKLLSKEFGISRSEAYRLIQLHNRNFEIIG